MSEVKTEKGHPSLPLVLDTPTLYILMRTDLDSLGPGKAMAQANHAYGAVRAAIRKNLVIQRDFLEWTTQTEQEFGTTIVLGGTVHEIDTVLYKANKTALMVSGWVHDPTYPIEDGGTVHVLPMDTCGFIFGGRRNLLELTRDLFLYTNNKRG